jgi:hypothetical protein
MVHKAKIDVYLFGTIVFGFAVLALGGNRWVAGPVLAVLLLCAFPQSYVTAADGLVVRAGLARTTIPYAAITFIGPEREDRVRVQYGLGSQFVIAPADARAFLADMGSRAPHLKRWGQRLVAALA